MKTLSGLKINDQQALKEFYNRLQGLLGDRLSSTRLFGSKAKGTDETDSDIDIFVVVKRLDFTAKSKILGLAFDVNLKYGVYVSPRIVPFELFQDTAFHSTPFVRNVEKEGVLL